MGAAPWISSWTARERKMAAPISPADRTMPTEGQDTKGLVRPQALPPRRRVWLRSLTIFLVVAAVLTATTWAAARYAANRGPLVNRDMKTKAVRRGELMVILTADGNVESAVNIDLKCEVAGGSAILWIVEDGDQVKKGDKLVELDSSTLVEQVNQQRITYEKARAVMIQAQKDFAAAKIAVQEYLEGTFVKALLDVDSKITIATENLRSSQNTLDHSQRMFRKGYISALDLASQTFSVERAQLELDSAHTAKEVLVKYTKVKMLQEFESKRDSAEAQVRSEGASFALEESRLKRLEAQVLKCVITAPADGMAVYANETDHHGKSEQSQIEEGAMIRERQTILRLPDLARMQVKINVHESRVEALGRALRRAKSTGQVLSARIEIQGKQLPGRLVSIANQPTPPDFRTGNLKQYPAIVAIEGASEALRPGMTAKCEIVLEKRTDVLMIPVTSVIEQQGEYLCWVTTEDGFQRRPLVLGTTGTTTDEMAEVKENNEMVEAKDGVRQGEQVVLNPRAIVPEARIVHEQIRPPKAANLFTQTQDHPADTPENASGVETTKPDEPGGSTATEK
jgi:HlyD family secretion protein